MTQVWTFLLLAQSTPMPAEVAHFPAQFHGVWDASVEACAADYNPIRIRIAGNEISYWGSDGAPILVESADENDVTVTLAMSGRGEAWQWRTRFVIDRAGNRVFAENLAHGNGEFVKTYWFYHRCPEETSMGSDEE